MPCPDSLVPLVVSSPKHADCLQTKKNELEKLEFKLDTGHLHSLIYGDSRYTEQVSTRQVGNTEWPKYPKIADGVIPPLCVFL